MFTFKVLTNVSFTPQKSFFLAFLIKIWLESCELHNFPKYLGESLEPPCLNHCHCIEIIKMPRGGKRGHKGGRKQFSNPQALEAANAKAAKEKEWRRQRGEDVSDTESEDENDEKKDSSSDDEAGGVAFKKESSESESESESEEEERKAKGAEGLIEIANPNRVQQKQKKVTAIGNDSSGGKPQLSRREREEIEKQKAKAHYQKMHAAGKTEEARADLARLAIIRKQREEAAKKREEEQKAKEAAAKASKK